MKIKSINVINNVVLGNMNISFTDENMNIKGNCSATINFTVDKS